MKKPLGRSMKSQSISHLNPSSLSLLEGPYIQQGPLSSGVKSFDARYFGLLRLQEFARPSNIYAKRWRALEYQPAEVSVITNQSTKATEIVSPRLPWPPTFLQGSSVIEFGYPAGPQIAQFDSAVLHLTVVSVCGLQSIPLSKFVNKVRASARSADSVHSGVVVAKMISYHQTLAKNAERLSTFVRSTWKGQI